MMLDSRWSRKCGWFSAGRILPAGTNHLLSQPFASFLAVSFGGRGTIARQEQVQRPHAESHRASSRSRSDSSPTELSPIREPRGRRKHELWSSQVVGCKWVFFFFPFPKRKTKREITCWHRSGTTIPTRSALPPPPSFQPLTDTICNSAETHYR